MPTTFSHSNVHSQMMSKSLEDAIRDYSRFLVDLPTLTTTDEIEYAQLELQELLSRHSKDARRYEQATIQKLAYLVSLYAKKRIVEKGIDTCGKGVLVDFEDSHYTF